MEKNRINKSILSFLLFIILGIFFGLGASLAGIYLYLIPNLPDIESLKEFELQTPLRIYSLDNKLIGEFGEKRRDPIRISETPPALIHAILAAEDDAFYEHSGVSVKSLLRAASELILSGEIQTGGSTITMQVARNFFLSRDQTFSRKFNEILLAIKIEQALSKEEILELYLNKIYLGNRAYGFKAASQAYYGKPLQQLSLAQIAMAAGLPKAPSTYNPIANPSRATIRRDWILERMLTLGKINQEDYNLAIKQPVTARYHGQSLDLNAPYIAEAAREKAIELFGEAAYTDGYKIYTTVDSRLQDAAQKAVISGLLEYDLRHGYRGPEQQLDPSQLEPLHDQTQAATNSEPSPDLVEQLGAVNLLPWIETLKAIPSYGGLQAGAVIRINKKSISVLDSFGNTVDITWENGLKDARPFITEDFAGKEPKTAAEIVKLGDIIRMHQDDKQQWHLSQVPKIEAALVSLHPDDGAIRSMVGGFDFDHSNFNRATQAERQPGSNIKPFIYAIGLENKLSPATVFNDAPIVSGSEGDEDWRPENSSGKFYGPTPLRKGLYLSRNMVSIRLVQRLGIDKTIRAMTRFGINTDQMPRNLSMALGTNVMTPMEVAVGYSTFANGGYKIEPYLVHHIRDRHDNILYQAEPNVAGSKSALTFSNQDKTPESTQQTSESNTATIDQESPAATAEQAQTNTSAAISVSLTEKKAKQIMDKRVAYLINSIMRDAIQRGTATRARSLGRSDLAGKTGTTNGPTDAWFSGYNSQLVTTTWVGFDNNKNIGRREYGGIAALPIWIKFMEVALDGVSDELPQRPYGIVRIRINPETGERVLESNPKGKYELFLQENTPAALDPGAIGLNSPATEELF